jgi:hypothetical protein
VEDRKKTDCKGMMIVGLAMRAEPTSLPAEPKREREKRITAVHVVTAKQAGCGLIRSCLGFPLGLG